MRLLERDGYLAALGEHLAATAAGGRLVHRQPEPVRDPALLRPARVDLEAKPERHPPAL
jgi:hypothetical protein